MTDLASWGTASAPARHALLRVEPAAYALMLAGRPDLTGEALLADWAALGRPLIARRRTSCDLAGCVAAGIALPPSHGKKRIALQLETGTIRAVAPPPVLQDAAHAAPAGWRAAIAAIVGLCEHAGVEARVFGALAWSSLTGLEYLSASSDLDLLVAVNEDTDVAALLHGLARIESTAPMRLDGEIVRLGLAANWRELNAGGREVLVKTIDGVLMRPRGVMFPSSVSCA
ncbi:malonate decarboxylase holo-[acyl-carrier-protein] synthase [Methylocella sp.]|uniref:malonate decarboxylase holo-[acyl-carrier-protein] synthase n=1 Tax=Methylocella sp. TaxID=1978226 RepID=UPI003C16FC7D